MFPSNMFTLDVDTIVLYVSFPEMVALFSLKIQSDADTPYIAPPYSVASLNAK